MRATSPAALFHGQLTVYRGGLDFIDRAKFDLASFVDYVSSIQKLFFATQNPLCGLLAFFDQQQLQIGRFPNQIRHFLASLTLFRSNLTPSIINQNVDVSD